jgi:hypothetical protein
MGGDAPPRRRFPAPLASGRLLITATMSTGSVPESRAAISASMLLPRPEIRMTIFFI